MHTPTQYRHTPDMGEISGFGGGYEAVCQDMLSAGVNWMMEKKLSGGDLKAHTFAGIYGLIEPDNDNARELEKVLAEAAHGDCTGAMMQALMERCIWISKHSWDEYCVEMRKAEAAERAVGDSLPKP